MPTEINSEKVRIDKWLWAARFFKTRSLAVDALECGKVFVDGERVKPSKLLAVGNTLNIRLGPYQHTVVVQALSDKRGPASQAQKLYQETAESRLRREALATEIKLQPATQAGRPTKRDRREIERMRRVEPNHEID